MFDFDALITEVEVCKQLAARLYGTAPHCVYCAPDDLPEWRPYETKWEAWAEVNDSSLPEDIAVLTAKAHDPFIAVRKLREHLVIALAKRRA